MSLKLPCRTDLPHYDFDVVLDGATFNLELRWSTREGSWYLSLRAEDGAPLVLEKKVALGALVTCRSKAPGTPAGVFIAEDSTGKGLPPGIHDLGGRVSLYYVTLAELAGA